MTEDEIIDQVLANEGGYVNHPNDRGHATKYGITARVLGEWRNLGRPATALEVQGLTQDEARAIYKMRYAAPFREIPFPELTAQLVDYGVLSGPATATMALQEVLGVKPDGIIGQRTKAALLAVPWRLTNNALVAQRAKFLFDITEEHPSQRVFLRGWLSRTLNFYVA